VFLLLVGPLRSRGLWWPFKAQLSDAMHAPLYRAVDGLSQQAGHRPGAGNVKLYVVSMFRLDTKGDFNDKLSSSI
jgi:hypothetical protein